MTFYTEAIKVGGRIAYKQVTRSNAQELCPFKYVVSKSRKLQLVQKTVLSLTAHDSES